MVLVVFYQVKKKISDFFNDFTPRGFSPILVKIKGIGFL